MTTPDPPGAALAAAEVDGGDMDCGSGLLLLLTRTMRRISNGEDLLVHTRERTVPPDLKDWARLAGHELRQVDADTPAGPWHIVVRRGAPAAPAGQRLDQGDPDRTENLRYSEGAAVPLGSRLWLYSNFHCNLACTYCCAESAPAAPARLLPVATAVAAAQEFSALGGRELFVTGGEPFLHPEVGDLLRSLAAILPVTVLTNGMVFHRGARRQALESLPRDRVVLQVSLDSAGPDLHDRHRGSGSHARAVDGIRLAAELGFVVRVAATMHPDELDAAGALHRTLAGLGIPPEHRVIRPVAQQGFAEAGIPVTIDDLEPEPALAADGVWWHPVAITDPAMRVADSPLPVQDCLDTIADTLAVQHAARSEGRRHVFRCA